MGSNIETTPLSRVRMPRVINPMAKLTESSQLSIKLLSETLTLQKAPKQRDQIIALPVPLKVKLRGESLPSRTAREKKRG